ncbi:hypothetical protein CRUP_014049 [Coryphaenoides rupestris]|nr:hypothetical protein CRUP_014049 [Coryphaenoides rupestris]
MANKEPGHGILQQLRQIAARMSSGPRGAGVGLKLLLGAGVLAYGVKEATFTVEGGQRAIIFNRIGGIQKDTVLAEGLHFRARPRKIASLTGSKDLQMVNIALRVLSRPLASNLPTMYQQLGTDYDERVLPSIVNEVSLLIRRDLFERAKDFNIILDDQEAQRAQFYVEKAKQDQRQKIHPGRGRGRGRQDQEAQRAQFYVEKAKQDQRQKIIQAEGEAEAAKMISQSQNKVYLNSDSLVLNLNDNSAFNKFSTRSTGVRTDSRAAVKWRPGHMTFLPLPDLLLTEGGREGGRV